MTGLIDRNFLKSVSNFLVIYYLLKFVLGSYKACILTLHDLIDGLVFWCGLLLYTETKCKVDHLI